MHPHSLVGPPDSGGESRREDPPPGKAPRSGEVLVCLDGSELGNGVVPHAQLVARALGSRLTLLRVLEPDAAAGAPADPLDWGIRQREARADLEGLAAKTSTLDSRVRSELIQGRAAEQICQWAEHHESDITALCSHGARGLTEWDLASTARKLIDRLPRSFLLVPAQAASAAEMPKYGRILVPLDGSARAESVIPLALRIAAAYDAEVLLLHVVPTPELTRVGPLEAEGVELERSVIERNQRVASDYLDRIRGRVRQAGVRVRTLVVRDRSVHTRLERIIREESVDIVVMSAHGHSGRTDSPCGSVTEHALTHATKPTLIVREDARRRMRRVGSPRGRSTPAYPATQPSW